MTHGPREAVAARGKKPNEDVLRACARISRPLRVDARDLALDSLARSFDDDPWSRRVLPEARSHSA